MAGASRSGRTSGSNTILRVDCAKAWIGPPVKGRESIQQRNADYYDRRAQRERALAATAPDWYVQKLIDTAEQFERRVEALRNPARRAPKRLLPMERRAQAVRG